MAEPSGHPDGPPAGAHGQVRAMLRQLGEARAGGALAVTGEPGGVIHLVDGWVHAVESVAAPTVGELLVGRDRITRAEWDDALAAADPAAALAAGGRMSADEVELCALEALHDAAWFTLATEPAGYRFHPDAPAPPAFCPPVDVSRLCDGVDRQRQALDDVHPAADNDHVAVVPVPRPDVDRVLLSGLQWEIVLHADGTRTPADLAKLLGRPAYAVLLDVRRLVAAGLVRRQPPTGGARPAAEGATHRPALPRRVPGSTVTDPAPASGHVGRRRAREAKALAKLPGMAAAPSDESVLLRIRAALRALQ